MYSFVSYTSLLFTDCSSSFVVLFPPLLCTSCFLHNCALQLLNHFNCLLLNFLFFLLSFTVLSFTHLILLFIPLIPSFYCFSPFSLFRFGSISFTVITFPLLLLFLPLSFPLFCFLLSSTTLFTEAKVSVTESSVEIQKCNFVDAAYFIVIVLHFLMSQLPPLCHTKA